MAGTGKGSWPMPLLTLVGEEGDEEIAEDTVLEPEVDKYDKTDNDEVEEKLKVSGGESKPPKPQSKPVIKEMEPADHDLQVVNEETVPFFKVEYLTAGGYNSTEEEFDIFGPQYEELEGTTETDSDDEAGHDSTREVTMFDRRLRSQTREDSKNSKRVAEADSDAFVVYVPEANSVDAVQEVCREQDVATNETEGVEAESATVQPIDDIPQLLAKEAQADKELIECVNDLVRSEEEHNVDILQQEQEDELGTTNQMESDMDSDEEENDLDMDAKGGDQGPVRGRKRRIGDGFDDIVIQMQNYRKRKIDPAARCPPPAPKKIRGGRRTLLKKTMESEVPEDEVQKACTVFKNRKSLRPAPDSATQGTSTAVSIATFQGPMAPLMLQHQMQEENNSNFKKTFQILPAMGIDYLKLCRKSKGFRNQMYFEHLNYVAESTYLGGDTVDPKKWLIQFAKAAKQRFRSKLKCYNAQSLGMLLQSVTIRASKKIMTMKNRYLQSYDSLSTLINNLDKISQAKGRIVEDLDDLHRSLSKTEPKFDELSMSGIRLVKMILDPPYIKSADGGMASRLVSSDQIATEQHFFFRWDKQKWTTKDLQALRQCIKEVIVTKKCDLIEARYRALLNESDAKREAELAEEGRTRETLNLPPVKRKRGRPTKEEVQQRDKYGVIHPVIANLPNGMTVTVKVTPKFLSDWRTNKERRWKGMSFEALVKEEKGHVHWNEVAQKMMMKSRKFRTADDCRLAWLHEVNPDVNTKRWTAEDTRTLKAASETYPSDWCKIAEAINKTALKMGNPVRTPYLCYFRFRNRIEPPARLEWTKEMDLHVENGIQKYSAHWQRIAASMQNDAATKRAVVERYKKNINPMLRTGSFTRVEDALLILTIEKLKPFLAREGHFGSLLAYLPWRYETTWRDRANNLFNDWIVPWTIEEDRLLLELAETMKRNWQKISEEFTSFKNRKGCLTRYKILKRNLKDERFPTLESYHESYAMTRYNVFQYRHLYDIKKLLTRVRSADIDLEEHPFYGLSRDEEPSEADLRHMLFAFDRDAMNSAIHSLEKYSESRTQYWNVWVQKHGKRKRTFDRRTFHREDPQSVASAIHIRGLKLKQKSRIVGITDFEDEIYTFYGRFCRTKPLNCETNRPYIPSGKDLIQWSAISRIIATKLNEYKEDDNIPANRKWRTRTPKKCPCCTDDQRAETGNKCANRKPRTPKVKTGDVAEDGTFIPKKRGRKPKVKEVDENGCEIKKIPKKRGRPPKRREPSSSSSDSDDLLEAVTVNVEKDMNIIAGNGNPGPSKSTGERKSRSRTRRESTESTVHFNIKIDVTASSEGPRTRSKSMAMQEI